MVATNSKSSIGIREFKANPGKFARLVRDSNQEIDLTIRGEVVARLVPIGRSFSAQVPNELRSGPTKEDLEAYWRRHAEIVQEIAALLPKGVSAADVVDDMRRDL